MQDEDFALIAKYIEEGKVEDIKKDISNGIKFEVDSPFFEALTKATKAKDNEAAKVFLPFINDNALCYILLLSCLIKNHDFMRVLFEHGVDLNRMIKFTVEYEGKSIKGDSFTAMQIAVIFDDKDALELILQNNGDMNIEYPGKCKIEHFAAAYNSKSCFDLIFLNNNRINSANVDGDTPIGLSLQFGHADGFKMLLKYNPDLVNASPRFKITQLACMADSIEILKYLSEHGFSLQIIEKDGWNLIHYCAKFHGPSCISFLVQNGVNIDERDMYGKTPMHLAAMQDSLDVIKILLDNNANINSLNDSGETPLHFAAMYKSKNIVDFLLKNNADATIKDVVGRTPYISIGQTVLPNEKETTIEEIEEVFQKYGIKEEGEKRKGDFKFFFPLFGFF